MAMRLLWAVVLITLLPFLASQRHDERRGALSYVVHKGCLYMAHYVRDNYPVLEATHDTSVGGRTNWVDWARDIAGASYLPDELLHGLLECGRGYTFFALSASQALIAEHNMSLPLIPGK
ncbi:uncharacterized protein [Haliotis asinina]|uniref:uncharacterized protein n=1 Tax=Haliotis asinina TaxID=109174 RepID=UPI003531BB8E